MARCGAGLPTCAHAARATSNSSFCLVDVEIERRAGQPVGPPGGAAHRLRSDGPDQQRRPAGLHRRRTDREDGVGDLLACPDPLHHRHAVGHAPHRLRGRVRADRPVVLVPAADAQTDGQPAAAEHVAGGQRLGQHHGIVQLRHHHRRHQPHPIGPRGQRAEQREGVRIVERDPLAPAQRRERPVVDHPRPRLQRAASRSASITGIVIPICTTAILARLAA